LGFYWLIVLLHCDLFFSSSASGERGQNNGGIVRLQGHRDILQKRGASGCVAKGQTFTACGSAVSAGQGPVRQRSLMKKSTFVTFGAAKVK
jgi:hypothetical protein